VANTAVRRRGFSLALGNSGSSTDDDLNADTGVAKHGDQGIDTSRLLKK
jgi:hypothetical protein